MIKNPTTLFFVIVMVTLINCSSSISHQKTREARNKITFSIEEIDENGLIGPPDGKRSIAYQFTIPADSSMKKEIMGIDPSVKFNLKKDNSIYWCIGEGATSKVLLQLASLPYIIRIDPFYWE